jgi:protein-tyrosine phosphatase
MKTILRFLFVIGLGLSTFAPAGAAAGTDSMPTSATTRPSVGERVPSDDAVLRDFHSLGLVNGQIDIFRCASPVRDLAAGGKVDDSQMERAASRMARLRKLGIRTIVCLEDPDSPDTDTGSAAVAKVRQLKARLRIEKAAAENAGIHFVMMPMANAGPHSLETMSDQQVLAWLEKVTDEIFKDADAGGVMFHCSAGHDRTGLVCAFIRVKYQHWPVEEAIDEMRRYGHNWVKYSNNGGISSWHEDHLRAIAAMLEEEATTRPAADAR